MRGVRKCKINHNQSSDLEVQMRLLLDRMGRSGIYICMCDVLEPRTLSVPVVVCARYLRVCMSGVCLPLLDRDSIAVHRLVGLGVLRCF